MNRHSTSDSSFQKRALYDSIPPGNKHREDVSFYCYMTSTALNSIESSNLKKYFQINVPYLWYIASERPSKKAVLIVMGGSFSKIDFEPEGTEAVEYWKHKKDVSIYLLFYRLPYFQNNLGNQMYSINDIYYNNAIPFLPLYDLHHAIVRIQKKYSSIILHGFSAGGLLSVAYTSIASYNYELLQDILRIVDQSSAADDQTPSQEFQWFLLRYQKNDYSFQQLSHPTPIVGIILNYPELDQTIPQYTTNYLNNLTSVNLTSFYPEAVNAVSLLFSSKLYSDSVSNAVTFQATYSMIRSNFPPTYMVGCYDDPYIQNTTRNLLTQWLNQQKVKNVRQDYLYGGHGFGMGQCYQYRTSYPSFNWPNDFTHHYYPMYSQYYGSDGIQGDYNSKNYNNWFKAPYVRSNYQLSLNEFVQSL